jgi:hypothetical protein
MIQPFRALPHPSTEYHHRYPARDCLPWNGSYIERAGHNMGTTDGEAMEQQGIESLSRDFKIC